jgi:hypothetical protein
MTLESAIHKATLFYTLVGGKVKNTKKGKIKVVTRITAYKKDKNDWDVAVFFETKYRLDANKPDCFLSKFIKDYDIIFPG